MDAASRTGIALVGAGALAGCVMSSWLQRESAALSDVMVKEKETPSGSKGTISLVGAGPGDPGLLTLQAVAELRAADLLITDKLTKEAMGEQRMRALLKPNCVLSVARNKRSKKRGVNVSDGVQDEINEEALAGALEGKRVVRLKSGDPFIYGRGGEEVLFFRKHGIECHVVAGISSVIAGPMAMGVPVLMRGFADQLYVGTGSTRGDKPPEVPEYSASRTYVYLMAMRNLNELVARMLERGFPADTPASVVQSATVKEQKALRTTIEQMEADVEREGLSSPAVITVGKVAKALDGTLGWDEYLAQFPPIVKEG